MFFVFRNARSLSPVGPREDNSSQRFVSAFFSKTTTNDHTSAGEQQRMEKYFNNKRGQRSTDNGYGELQPFRAFH